MARNHSRSISGIAFAYAVLAVSPHGQATSQGASVLPVRTTAKLYNGISDDIVGGSLNFFATASAGINPECRSLVARGAFDHAHSTSGVTKLELSKLELSTAVQLLELSVVFMDRGEFQLAKSILALCACSFGPGLSETYIRSSQLRWRMGLHHLDPFEIDDWLGWKKSLPASSEEERIEELSFLAHYSINKIGLIASCATCICSCIIILITSPFFAHAFNGRKRLAKLWRKTAQDCAHATEAASPLRILEDHTECVGHSLFLQNPSTMLEDEKTIHLYSLSPKDSTCLADRFRVTSAEDSSNKTARGIAKEFAQMTEYFEDAVAVDKCTEKNHIRVESVYASSEQSTHEGSEAFHSDLSSENVEADIVRDLPRYAAADVRFLENVGKSDVPLAEQVRALSKEAFGEHEDAMQTRKHERICAMLVGEKVVSYASYTLRRNLMALSINKFAVACVEQRRGLGRIMIRHLIQIAKRRSRADTPVAVLSLSALAASVGFYRACGFHEDSSVKSCSSDDAIEGQVYMEYTLKRKRSK